MHAWWQTFYSGIWIEMLNRGRLPEVTVREATAIAHLLRMRPGMRVLDVPCGNGRLSLALAAHGLIPTAVDQSEELISRGRREMAVCGFPGEWVCCDMRYLPWVEAFDGAFCYWGSFGYFSDKDNAG